MVKTKKQRIEKIKLKPRKYKKNQGNSIKLIKLFNTDKEKDNTNYDIKIKLLPQPL